MLSLTGFLAYAAGLVLGLIILILEYQLDKIQGNNSLHNKQIITNEVEKKKIKLEVQSNIMENFQSIQSQTENLIKKIDIDENSIALRFYLELNSLKRNFIRNVLSDKTKEQNLKRPRHQKLKNHLNWQTNEKNHQNRHNMARKTRKIPRTKNKATAVVL